MLVTIEFQDEFENINRGTKIGFDPEYNDSIENLKVLITLKYTELEMKKIHIYYHGKRLKNTDNLNILNIKEGATLQVRKRRSGCCCF